MIRVRVAATLVVLGMLGTAAFSGVTGAAQGDPLSKQDFITAGDNICRQGEQLRQEAAATVFADLPPGEEPTVEQLTAYVTAVQPIIQQQLDGLRSLPVASSEKKKVKRILKAGDKALAKIVEDPGALVSGIDPFVKADKLARKFGFKVCGAEHD